MMTWQEFIVSQLRTDPELRDIYSKDAMLEKQSGSQEVADKMLYYLELADMEKA